MLTRTPRRDDWVVATAPIPVTLTDQLVGVASGIKRGSKGVVLGASHGLLRPTALVRFDCGFHTRDVRAPLSKLRVTRRNGGRDGFEHRASLFAAARLGVAIALLAPLGYFVITYLFAHQGADGLVPALVDSAVATAGDTLEYALDHPVEAAVFFLLTYVLSQFAFR